MEESHETKQLITSLGTVTFKKTLFKNKETGKANTAWTGFLDWKEMNALRKMRFSRMLVEAIQTSYRRGGEEASLTTDVKKQIV